MEQIGNECFHKIAILLELKIIENWSVFWIPLLSLWNHTVNLESNKILYLLLELQLVKKCSVSWTFI